MSFSPSDIVYMINTIEDLLFLMDSQQPLRISAYSACNQNEKSFIKLCFPLKNDNMEIQIYDNEGLCIYPERNGENLKSVKFNQNNITNTEATGSFHKALKEIRDFDRQQVSIAKNSNTSIDRASFGLTEVN